LVGLSLHARDWSSVLCAIKMLVPLWTNGHKNIKAQYNARLTFVGGTDDNRWIDLSNVATSQFLCRFVQEHGKSIHRLDRRFVGRPPWNPLYWPKKRTYGPLLTPSYIPASRTAQLVLWAVSTISTIHCGDNESRIAMSQTSINNTIAIRLQKSACSQEDHKIRPQ
jgi:hypothetical protein